MHRLGRDGRLGHQEATRRTALVGTAGSAGRHNGRIARSVFEPVQPRRRRRLLPAVLLAVLLAGAAAIVIVALAPGGKRQLLVPRERTGIRDPLGFDTAQQHALEQAAASGLAHVLYVKSPGGVLAAAARTTSFRRMIDTATAGTGVDPDLLEAIVFLESSGRQDAIAGGDPANAAGLTQIVAETGRDFLHMAVDLAASRRLTREIDAAAARGDVDHAEHLRAQRRLADTRFDPEQALAATVRYLVAARERFGRDDLAVVSYHMGIGNLESVLRDYIGSHDREPIGSLVSSDDLSWARVYFDASPAKHADAWRRLSAFSDDSQTYYWRVLAAREMMRLYRRDRGALKRLIALQSEKASAEDVLHPPDETRLFRKPGDLEHAWSTRLLQPLPHDPAHLHFKVDSQMGALAPRLGKKRSLYRGLRAEALALLLYLADRIYALSGETQPLTVVSAVRDGTYQSLLAPTNPEAGPAYSLHATGYAFDVVRRYGSGAQAAAFQYELERLQARNLIAWIREPHTIHITVSSDAKSLITATLRPAQ
jgi:Transglycosylase SLT domain